MDERRTLIDELNELYRTKLEQGLDDLEDEEGGVVTMDRIEGLVQQIETEMGRELTQRILDRQPDEAANKSTCPHCHAAARFHSDIERVLISLSGEVRRSRRWYRCVEGHGFSPLDRRLGLDSGATTPTLRRLIAEWAADRPFEVVVRDLKRSRGLVLGESTVERAAVACGQRLRALSERMGEEYEAGAVPEAIHEASTVYLSMDGVYAPLRDEWKKDGSAGSLACRGGECKVGMAYAIEVDRRGHPRVAWKEYVATFGDIKAFRPQMAALAHKCGVFQAKRQVFLADTLACNWTLAADYFPEATQIVDVRHAQEHIKDVANAFFGADTQAGRDWIAARKSELLEGEALGVSAEIADLPVLAHETQEQAETRCREAAYFANNHTRMQDKAFREAGLQIGSGVMEASCRTVVNQRLDQSGMHWRQETADKMVALRAALLSTTRPDFRVWGTAA